MLTLVRLAGIVALALAGCRRAERPDGEAKSAEPGPAKAAEPAFTFGFETRDHQLWLHTDTEPQLYTVKTRSGEVVAGGIDERRLELDFPALYELVRGGSELIDVIDLDARRR